MPLFNSQQLLDTMEKTVAQTIKKATALQSLPEAKLKAAPAPGKWSVLQAIYHLESYNGYYLPHIAGVIKNGKNYPATPSFKAGLLGNYFANAMLPGNNGTVKNAMKAPAGHTPAPGFADTNVLVEFINSQQQLLRLIKDARAVNITRLTVPISIAKFIKIRLGDTFRFLIAHQQRHFAQVANTLKALGVEGVAV